MKYKIDDEVVYIGPSNEVFIQGKVYKIIHCAGQDMYDICTKSIYYVCEKDLKLCTKLDKVLE